MATSALPLLLLALSLSAVSVYGRPCKTLFFYATTTTTSYYPTATTTAASFPQNPNPSFNSFSFQRDLSHSPKFLTLFFTSVNSREDGENHHPIRLRFRPNPNAYVSLRRYPFPIHTNGKELFDEEKGNVEKRLAATTMPLGFYSSVTRSSIRDRTRDIMSVVGALLFGVGCGALTAATMYLIWSLLSPNRFDFDDSDDDSEDDGASPKKLGYTTIPDEDIDAVKKAAQAQALAKGGA